MLNFHYFKIENSIRFQISLMKFEFRLSFESNDFLVVDFHHFVKNIGKK
jgi:hypothetical protein